MGSIKKLKNGKYRISVYDKFGNRLRLHFDKQSHAKAFIDKIENEKSEEKLVNRGLLKKRVLIETASDEFMETKIGLRERTTHKYKAILDAFLMFCNNHKILFIDEFKNDHADIFRKELISSCAAAKTVNHYLLLAKALFTLQVSKDKLIKNPFAHINLVKKQSKTQIQREQDYFTKNELELLFNEQMPMLNLLVFISFYLTGCRFAELANLEWETNIDFENRLVKIRSKENFSTKTLDSERNIPMTNSLYEILKFIKNCSASSYVFVDADNQIIKERNCLREFKDAAKSAGILKNATIHKLRHSFASHLIQAGLNFEERQYLLGHKPKSMTEYYTKIDPDSLRDKIQYLDSLLPTNLLKEPLCTSTKSQN